MNHGYIIERGEYKGNAMLIIKTKADDKYAFQFGLGKARKIVACIEEIRAFVEEHASEQNGEK